MTKAALSIENYFNQIGDSIKNQFSNGDGSSETFTQIATETLLTTKTPEALDHHSIADWAFSRKTFPQQPYLNSEFGKPPLCVYNDANFYVEVLFWFPSTTAIHSHGFAGAFKVLQGYSLHPSYQFTESEKWHESVRNGSLEMIDLEWLGPQSVKSIRDEETFIHSVAHLGAPSLTLVARTHASNNTAQWSYKRTGLALQAHQQRSAIKRKRELIESLKEGSESQYKNAFLKLFEHADLYQYFNLYNSIKPSFWTHTLRDEINALAKLRFGEHCTNALIAQLKETQRGRTLWEGPQFFKDPADWIKIALSVIFSDDEARNVSLRQFFPNQTPEAIIASWEADIQKSSATFN